MLLNCSLFIHGLLHQALSAARSMLGTAAFVFRRVGKKLVIGHLRDIMTSILRHEQYTRSADYYQFL